nr:3-hydroxyacyl-CoA dehydrogenase NAD-binding domain-containing protein [Acinetobacter baumannii]
MEGIKIIGVVGVGVIGASWTALFLYKGFKVKVYDPYPIDEELFKKRIQANLSDLLALDQQTDSIHHLQDIFLNLELYNNLKDAVIDADFIQENAPERLDLKQNLYQEITSYCPEKTLIASSSSGLKVSDFQKDATHPQFFLKYYYLLKYLFSIKIYHLVKLIRSHLLISSYKS